CNISDQFPIFPGPFPRRQLPYRRLLHLPRGTARRGDFPNQGRQLRQGEEIAYLPAISRRRCNLRPLLTSKLGEQAYMPMLSLKKRASPLHSVNANPVPMADFIPYFCHWDAETLITKEDELVQILKIDGFPFETADDEDLDIKKQIRNTLWKSFASGRFSAWF